MEPVNAQGQSVTELRDYHAENIMLLEGKTGLEGFGLLDFQDALIGHPAYDLVSMLDDPRRDVPLHVEARTLPRNKAVTRHGADLQQA